MLQPSQTFLLLRFIYNPNTGELRYRDDNRLAGNKRYRRGKPLSVRIYICKYGSFCVSRIIWKIMTGNNPVNTIDHEDNNPFNMKWDNLREATITEQLANRRIRHDNTHGYKGVGMRKDKYYARIYKDGKQYYLGNFDTAQEAHQAYRDAALDLYGKFANYG